MRSALCLLALCVACASEWAPVGPLLREGRNNDFAATQKYRSQELRLSGVVVATGEKKIEHGAGRTDGTWAEAPATKADVPHAFVQLRDAERPSPDTVTCYLDGATTKLAYGTPVRVHGFFLEFVAAAGHVDAVLDRCSVE